MYFRIHSIYCSILLIHCEICYGGIQVQQLYGLAGLGVDLYG